MEPIHNTKGAARTGLLSGRHGPPLSPKRFFFFLFFFVEIIRSAARLGRRIVVASAYDAQGNPILDGPSQGWGGIGKGQGPLKTRKQRQLSSAGSISGEPPNGPTTAADRRGATRPPAPLAWAPACRHDPAHWRRRFKRRCLAVQVEGLEMNRR